MLRLCAVLLLGILSFSLGACASPVPESPGPAPYQIIIKFRAPVADPANPHFVQQLSLDAGATLALVRTLATGAQLYSLDGKLTNDEFENSLNKLRQRPDVLYVEADRRVQPVQKN